MNSAFCQRFLLLWVCLVSIGPVLSAREKVPEPAPGSERLLQSGKIVGYADKHETYGWLGIPFAAPPVEALRWRAPRPVTPWTGTREATTVGSVCPQLGSMLSGTGVRSARRITGEEDCLYLNVWTPRFEANALPTGAARLPVMVWIHGGGNSIGTANTYRIGRNLAGEHKVVFVALNYRLGVLGWFRHPGLDEADSSPEDRSGNYGTLDQIQALHWVQHNIAAFGGDPDNVTVFGESAGGINTYALLLSPLAKGLFHKAIVQSGVPISTPLSQAVNFHDDAQPGDPNSAQELLARWLIQDGRSADGASAKKTIEGMRAADIRGFLRGRSTRELLTPFKGAGLGMYQTPQLFRDGVVLPTEAPIEVLADPTRYNAVPTILGTNRDEMKLFLAFNRTLVRWRLGLFPKVKDAEAYDRMASYLSDTWKAAGVDFPASIMSQRTSPPVYAYRFDWDEEPAGGLVNFQQLFGAAHGLEIAFVFHDLDREMNLSKLWNDENEAGRLPLTAAMASYWTHFAYTGTPGRGRTGSLTEWRPWAPSDASSDRLLLLDTVAGGGIRMVNLQLTRKSLQERLSSDPAFAQDAEARCALYVRMFGGFGRRVGWWDPNEYAGFGPTGCAAFPAERYQLRF